MEWLEKGKVVEDFAVAGLRSDVISRLPDDMKRVVLTVQMAKEVKPYRGPGSGYKPFPSDLLLNVYENIDRNRLITDLREITKEFVKTSSDVSRLNSQNVVLKILNLSLEKERDLWKKETSDLLGASSRAIVEDTQMSGEMFQKANQIIAFYRSFLVRLAAYLYLLFPSKAVDRLIDFTWELETMSRKRTSIQKNVLHSTSRNPSTETEPQEPPKIKTQAKVIGWI